MATSSATSPITLSWKTLWVILACSVVAAVAVTRQSFWIDEANSAWKAVQPCTESFWMELVGNPSSDTQMPGYMFGLWVWEKLFGAKEHVLRLFNLPWLLLTCWVLSSYWRVPQSLRLFVMALFLVSPFTWFYLNEARPYVMQIAGGMMAACGLHHLVLFPESKERRADLVVFLVGTLILSAASLLAMSIAFLYFVAGALGIALRTAGRKSWCRDRGLWICLGLVAPLFGALAGYYLWTLGLGARASGVGSTGWGNLMFALYELTGFTGLGPDRNAIRESMGSAFRPFVLPLALGVGAYAALGIMILRGLRAEDHRAFPAIIWAVGLLAATLGCAFCIGWFGEFRLLGRHLAPAFSMLMMLLGVGMLVAWRRPKGRVVVVLLFGVLLVSSLNQRFHPRYAKDDYRGAAVIAERALEKGQIVWWAADPMGANFYGIYPVHVGDTGRVFFANNRSGDYLRQLPAPDLVVFSKEDVYDQEGALRTWLRVGKYQVAETLTAFTVWRRMDGPCEHP